MSARFDFNSETLRSLEPAPAAPVESDCDPRLRSFLPVVFVFLAVGFACVTVWQLFFARGESLWKVTLSAASLFLSMRLCMNRFAALLRNPHATATVGAVIAMAVPIAALAVSKAPWPTIYMAAGILCLGFLYSSRAWFYSVMIGTSLAWYAVAGPNMQSDGWVQLGLGLFAASVCAAVMLDLRLRRYGSVLPGATAGPTSGAAFEQEKSSSARTPWCPVCKASPNAIIRHDGQNIIDANMAATEMLGLGHADFSSIRVNGIFAQHKRDSVARTLRIPNFSPFETLASGCSGQEIPVEVFPGSTAPLQNGLRAFVLSDLRKVEKIRQEAAATNRKAQLIIRRQAELAALAETVDSAGALNEILGKIVTAIHRTLPASIGAMIVLWDNEKQAFTVAANSTIHDLDSSKLSIEDEKGLVGALATSLRKIVVENLNEDQFAMGALYPKEPVKAFAAFPLINGPGIIGFLLALERSPKEFAVEDLDYLTVLAHRASSACNQAMLQEQLNSLAI